MINSTECVVYDELQTQKHLVYEELGLFSPEIKRLRGHVRAAFNYLIGSCRLLQIDILLGGPEQKLKGQQAQATVKKLCEALKY